MIEPRVLIISNNSFSNTFNNGKTLEALFSTFHKGNIAQLYFHEGSEPDFSFCERYWKISEMDLIRSVGKKTECIGVKKEPSSELDVVQKTKGYPKTLRMIKEKTGDVTRDLLWKWSKWESAALYDWINEFEPQVIFFVGSSASFSTKVALRLSTKLSIPLAVYYTDDYLLSLPQNTFLQRKKYNRINKLYKSIVEASSAHFAIGEMMAGEYSRYFNKPFHPIMNAVQIEPYEDYQEKEGVEIVYFGGLHLNRWQMLVRLANLLPAKAKLVVYTAPENIDDNVNKGFESSGVVYRGLLSGDELKEAMKSADVLLHVESDDKNNRTFTRLAVSTKIPEYLITGRPVLGFGPIEVASMKLLSDNGVGVVINSENDDSLVKKNLSDFLADFNERKQLGLQGYAYAKKTFDKEITSKCFMDKLSNIAKVSD